MDPAQGLSAEEAARRLESQGPNRLTGGKTESGFQAFVRQYQDFMQIVLLVAAVVNLVVTELGVFDVGRPGLTLVDLAPGVTVEEIRGKTEAPFVVHGDLKAA